jgi:hypothetical protein
MKIKSIKPVIVYYVETDEDSHNNYIRYHSDIWSCYGSIDPDLEIDCPDEIEKLFQKKYEKKGWDGLMEELGAEYGTFDDYLKI